MHLKHLLPVFCLFAAPVYADQIVLENGDQLSGKIVRMEADKLTLKPLWGEPNKEITVSWPAVSYIELTTPAHVVLRSGAFDGTIKSDRSGSMQIASGAMQTGMLRRDDIVAINPVKPVDPAAFKYTGRLDAGLGFARGNTETNNYYFSGKLKAENTLHRTVIKGEVRHETGANSVVTTDRSRLSTKYDRFLSTRRYLYAQGIVEQDKLASIDLRTTAGVGSGYQVYREENLNLGLESGLSHIRTQYHNAPTENKGALRLGVDYSQYFWSRGLKVENASEIFIPVSSVQGLLLRSKTALLVPVGKNIATGLAFTADWDRNHAPDKKPLDTSLQATLGYGF
jgi:putative salt-induced outer membrane protein YdiY